MYNIQWAKVFHSGGGFFNFYGKFDKGWFVSDTDDMVHVYSADTTEMIKEWCDSGDTLTWEKRYEKKGQEFSNPDFFLEALDVIKQDPKHDAHVVDSLYEYYLSEKLK